MPIRDPAKKNQYQREWIAKQRADWLSDKCCLDCGSTSCLEIDHVDPKTKVTHRIWSWSKKRREEELAKCVVRCEPCHLAKTLAEGEISHPGEANPSARLTVEQVLEIRRLASEGKIQVELGRLFGVNRRTIYDITHRRTWQHI